jgi:uncharacterized membrane protein
MQYKNLTFVLLSLGIIFFFGVCLVFQNAAFNKSIPRGDGIPFAGSLWNTNFVNKFLYHGGMYYYFGYKSFLNFHFAPILFLLVPIYRVFPSPFTLSVIQIISVALTGYLVYYFGFLVLHNKNLALFIALVFLFNPMTFQATLDIPNFFHPDSLIPFFMFLVAISLISKKDTSIFLASLCCWV